MTARLRFEALSSPRWFRSLLRNGIPRFVSFAPYIGARPDLRGDGGVRQREFGGAFTWDEIARYRDRWKKPMVLKGVLHPDDAERAVSLGLDGIFVSNHGGRQIDALPPSIDLLPGIAERVGGPGDDHPRQRRAVGRRRRARDRARRGRGVRRQGVPVEPRRARRAGSGAPDRPLRRGHPRDPRPARLRDASTSCAPSPCATTAHSGSAIPDRAASLDTARRPTRDEASFLRTSPLSLTNEQQRSGVSKGISGKRGALFRASGACRYDGRAKFGAGEECAWRTRI